MKRITDSFMIYVFQPLFNLYFSLSKKQLGKNIYQITPDIKLKIRPQTSDTGVISEIYDLKEYTRHFKISPKDTIVDIGAHIGAFSILASRLANKGKVFSYEPSPENYDLLVKNMKLNSLKNLYAKNIAVASSSRKLNLYLTAGNHGANSIFKNNGSTKCIKIDAIPLSKIFSDNKIKKIDFLKIDAEGAEYEILLNTPKKILDKITKIALEYHDNLAKGQSHEELKEYLEQNGFKVTVQSYPFMGNIYKTGLLMATKTSIK